MGEVSRGKASGSSRRRSRESVYHRLVFTLPSGFTAGEPRCWRRVPGLVLAEVDYPASSEIFERHGHARFLLILQGRVTIVGATRGSSLWFCAADTLHVLHVAEVGARGLILDMDDSWMARVRQGGPVLTRSTGFATGFVTHLAWRLGDEFRRRDEVSRLAIESLALGLVAEASRRVMRDAESDRPDWLERARAFVDRHFAEHLALADVAEVAGVHPVHLARAFRRSYDTTLGEYVRGMRLEFARQQLVSTAAPLGDIAAAAGFCDQSHFCRLFKQATGVSPAVYRQSARRR
jgi:AraC family transcriptional regulator